VAVFKAMAGQSGSEYRLVGAAEAKPIVLKREVAITWVSSVLI